MLAHISIISKLPKIFWPLEETVRSANNLNVFIAQDKSDEKINITLAKLSKEQYEKFGYDVSLFEFEGGHEINAEAKKEVEKWIKNQK